MSYQSHTASSVWKELKQYLVTNKEIGNPRTANPGVIKETQFRNESIVDVKIHIINTAPVDSDYPLVVFTGVGIAIKDIEKNTYIKAPTHWLVDYPKSRLVDYPKSNVIPSISHYMLSHEIIANPASQYKGTTDDERNQGIVLFPGGQIFFHLIIPVSELRKYKFSTEGNISFRHFSRVNDQISIDVKND